MSPDVALTDCLACERCGATERIDRSPELGVALCGDCFDARTDAADARVRAGALDNTWAPADLTAFVTGGWSQEPPALLRRTDHIGLVYRERIHSLTGEPEAGKGWLAQLAVAERLAAGERVLYVDFEEGAPAVVDRLLDLGAAPEAILKHFVYVRPDEPITDEARDALCALSPALAVIDGVTEALATHGLDLRDNSDVATWLALLPRPLQRAGAAVVLLDHVTKDREARGRFAIGAQHKLAGVDVAYELRVVEPFGRGRDGSVKVLVHKDRPGFVRRYAIDGRVATLELRCPDEGGVRAELVPPEPGKAAFRPTALMEKVSRTVEDEPGLSKRALRAAVAGKDRFIDLAIELLLAEGFIELHRDGQAHRHRSLTPFRDGDRGPVADRGPTVAGHGADDRGPVARPIGGPRPRTADAALDPEDRGPTVEAAELGLAAYDEEPL